MCALDQDVPLGGGNGCQDGDEKTPGRRASVDAEADDDQADSPCVPVLDQCEEFGGPAPKSRKFGDYDAVAGAGVLDGVGEVSVAMKKSPLVAR